MFIVGSFPMGMELPTLQVYYTIDSPGGQCCRGQRRLWRYLLNTSYRQRSISFFRFSFSFGESTGVRLSSTMFFPGRGRFSFLSGRLRTAPSGPPFQIGVEAFRFPLVLWGNTKKQRPVKSAAPSSFSMLRASLARGQDCQCS